MITKNETAKMMAVRNGAAYVIIVKMKIIQEAENI
jgi:hypothetical protein